MKRRNNNPNGSVCARGASLLPQRWGQYICPHLIYYTCRRPYRIGRYHSSYRQICTCPYRAHCLLGRIPPGCRCYATLPWAVCSRAFSPFTRKPVSSDTFSTAQTCRCEHRKPPLQTAADLIVSARTIRHASKSNSPGRQRPFVVSPKAIHHVGKNHLSCQQKRFTMSADDARRMCQNKNSICLFAG